ncbi:hypothetical protein BGZ60DRAFT_560087 [Tricladium varicosporioides]|nr:hypothetical protein BGZ60DRAFT_560087 [Hymenoscyphus varicosporioides]
MLFSTIVGALTLFASSAVAQEPSSDDVKVVGITYGGSGCPQGSLGVSYGPDKNFHVQLQNFRPSIGANQSVVSQRVNCQLNINFSYPKNLQFSPGYTTFTGYASLSSTASALFRSTWYFSGSSAQVSISDTLNGEYRGDYVLKEEVAEENRLWSQCGVNLPLNINMQIRMSGKGEGLVDNGELVAGGLVWRYC